MAWKVALCMEQVCHFSLNGTPIRHSPCPPPVHAHAQREVTPFASSQYIRLLHYCGLPKTDIDFIYCDGMPRATQVCHVLYKYCIDYIYCDGIPRVTEHPRGETITDGPSSDVSLLMCKRVWPQPRAKRYVAMYHMPRATWLRPGHERDHDQGGVEDVSFHRISGRFHPTMNHGFLMTAFSRPLVVGSLRTDVRTC